MKKPKKIVTIGGGTGLFTLLTGLKKYPFNLTAIVAITDDGGSNKKFRDEFGLLPPSDFRQCLVALSREPANSALRELMMYRFSRGRGFKGQTFGNILIAALTDIEGSQLKAFIQAGKILNIRGKIVPVSTNHNRLVAEYENGEKVFGEHIIDEPNRFHDSRQRIEKLFLDKPSTIYHKAKKAIMEADYIILGPGDLYTSTLANVVVKGVPEAIRNSSAKIIYVVNLMTKYGQTYGLSAQDHVLEIKKYLGKLPDYILINKTILPKAILKRYETQKHDFPVKDNLAKDKSIIRKDLLSNHIVKKHRADKLERSLIRHDSDKLARVIWGINNEK